MSHTIRSPVSRAQVLAQCTTAREISARLKHVFDDGQVTRLVVEKYHAAIGEQPHTRVTICSIEGTNP